MRKSKEDSGEKIVKNRNGTMANVSYMYHIRMHNTSMTTNLLIILQFVGISKYVHTKNYEPSGRSRRQVSFYFARLCDENIATGNSGYCTVFP